MSRYVTRAVQALAAYTPGEQPKAERIVKLNTNENPYPPSPAVGAALAAFDTARLRLYPDPLCAALRERIAAIHGCAAGQVFVGNGSDEILALCTRAFVEDDGAVGGVALARGAGLSCWQWRRGGFGGRVHQQLGGRPPVGPDAEGA